MAAFALGLSSRTGSGYHAPVRLASEAEIRGRLTHLVPAEMVPVQHAHKQPATDESPPPHRIR
jgi:hypothetical protein